MTTATTATAGVPLVAGLGRFLPTPADLARYCTSAKDGARALGTQTSLVAGLASAGLAHRADPARGPLFDYDDLLNAGLFSGSGRTVPELGRRYAVRFAAGSESSWYEPLSWQLTIRPPRRVPGGPRVSLSPLDTEAPGIRLIERDAAAGSAVVQVTGQRHTVSDPRVRPLWDEIVDALDSRAVRYQLVSEQLRRDHRRAWESGVADCVVASKELSRRLRSAGVAARVRRGYLLGLFGTEHAWCEVIEEGVAKPLDPVFAHLATAGAAGIPANPDFARACFGGRFNRLVPCAGQNGEPLVLLDGLAAPHSADVAVSAKPWSSR